MPLSGGPADKIGNRYEKWWTVSQLIRIIQGEAESIRIEDPSVDKAEFVVVSGGYRELHQVKLHHPRGKWSLSALHGLLQTMFNQLADDKTKFVFVSGSDAPELRELTKRARDAKHVDEFESIFVRAESQKNDLQKLKDIWKVDRVRAYEILKRIKVRTLDEQGIKDQVCEGLPALFSPDPDPKNVCDALRSLAEDSIHQDINREDLISHLQSKGFALRQLANPSDAPSLVDKATDRYLKHTRRNLIRDTLIPRAATRELLTKIEENENACVLTGKAGGGKTGCVIEFVETIRRQNNRAVLAFRLDRIDPAISSTNELGERLRLEESPTHVLATAAESKSREAVLVIDQLDAVSTTSGRSSDLFDVVEDLLAEAKVLRPRVKVVLVCREFDWENDHRLRRPLPKDHPNVSVEDFSLDEVKSVLEESGINLDLFYEKQLDLLRLPQNLSLFFNTNYDLNSRPPFFSEKDLFDDYWDEKREAIKRRVDSDHWMTAIQVLCNKMTESQQLSVLREKLDTFSPDYLKAMASEGVLSFDGKRYGFGHEAFFDYCFARIFVTKDESLTAFLTKSKQHLFLRAQVRQVLTYLRDADPERYCEELRALLTHERIRCHLKDLAIAVAVAMPDPTENEWDVLAPWIYSELQAIKSDKPNLDKFASLAWNQFFFFQSWFQITDSKGLIADWLDSGNDHLVDRGVNYVRVHQRHSGDRVAELLEPFVGRDGDWPQRFNEVMKFADPSNSRRFFDLFLTLIDNGTLDDTDMDSSFRLVTHSLKQARPKWIPEVVAHWLQRRVSVIQQTGDSRTSWSNLFNNDQFDAKQIYDSASKIPEAFAKHVLPVVLKIADEAVFEDQTTLPKHDEVWRRVRWFDSEYISIDRACINGLAVAVEKLAERKSERIAKIFEELQRRDTDIANFLLLRAYTAGAKHFADDAVSELCNKTWRFQCGYSSSPRWVAVQLIKAITPLCSTANRAKLEQAILAYVPNYELTSSGYKSRGWACFELLSGIPIEFRSKNAQVRYRELERKFGTSPSPPRGVEVDTVVSPIADSAAKKMTDEQWLKAIQRYDSEEISWGNLPKGGALELARTWEGFVTREPERFARLSLEFPPATHPSATHPFYLMHTLSGLKKTEGLTNLKLAVCRKAYSESHAECGMAIADLLGSIAEPLPDDAIQMLNWLATEHPDPKTGDTINYSGDIIFFSPSTRGRAAEAIRDLIIRDANYIERFRATIKKLTGDKSIDVRSCVASVLLYVTNSDWAFALAQFARLIDFQISKTDGDRLLGTPYAEHFIFHGLREHFDRLRGVVERMLRSELPEISEAGARMASLAVLYHHDDAENLVEEALSGNSSQRLGVAKVASANIGQADCRQWSEQQLLRLFNDSDEEVLREVAICFHSRSLEGQSLESYGNLIDQFCDSAAYCENPSSILRALEQSTHQLPGITCVVCEKFLDRFGDEARDIRTGRAGHVVFVAKLVFRTYHQHQRDEWADRCLDLIDQMYLERIRDVNDSMDEYER